MSAPNGAKVLRFPVERVTQPEPTLVIAWYRCGGGCGRLVTSAHALCLSCCVEDR